MLDASAFQIPDLSGLSPEAAQAATQAILAHVNEQALQISRKDQELKFKNAKLEKLTFELARHKAWRFGAKTERMNAEQRQIFEETLAEDQASLEAQIQALKGTVAPTVAPSQDKAKRPRRQALPEHLRRVDHNHEPESKLCPSPECGQAMTRVGEDVSERLDIVPAEFFVHRHIYGKWACRCCQLLVQEPAEPQIVECGIPSAGLVAHTLVSRFVDHLPYYRQETINARSGVHTPRSTLASWSGVGGAALEPLHEALKHFVLSSAVVQADETPVDMLDPGAGKTKKAYIWGYARGAFDPEPAVVYDFCTGRGGRFPMEFLRDWSGTLVRDEYKGYESVVAQRERKASGCLAHARRKYDELLKHNSSPVAAEAIERIAQIYRVERELLGLSGTARLAQRREHAGPLWKSLHDWLTLEVRRVPEGGATAKAINYSLNHWEALTHNLSDGDVPLDNNHLENLMRPWAMGRRAWLFCGSELAGQRAANVMSLVVSAKLNGHDPWAYLKDVLTRLPTHLNSRIDELLPHRWQAP